MISADFANATACVCTGGYILRVEASPTSYLLLGCIIIISRMEIGCRHTHATHLFETI